MGDLSDVLNTEQTKGLFEIPIVHRLVYLEHFQERIINSELVIVDELYYRKTLQSKLNAPSRTIDGLVKLGILRLGETEERAKPVDPLSLAQFLSLHHGKPIDEILKSREYFHSNKFKKKKPVEQVRMLWDAYSGSYWFERFRASQKRKFGKKNPKLSSFAKVSRQEAVEMLGSKLLPTRHGYQISEAGFFIPETKFVNKGVSNYINKDALAEFFSLLYGVNPSRIYVKDEGPLEKLAENFLYNKLMPYADSNGINLSVRYDAKSLARLTKIPKDKWRVAISHRALPTWKDGYRHWVLGLDACLYALKKSENVTFTTKRVKSIFGKDFDPEYYGFKKNKNNAYSRTRYVFPLYNRMADIVRDIMNITKRQSELETAFGSLVS